MSEYEPITEEGVKEAARLLHKNNPSISYNRFLSFLCQFIGHDMTEQEFTSEIQGFELEDEVSRTLLEDVGRGRLGMTVNEEGQFLFYELEKKKRKSKKKR